MTNDNKCVHDSVVALVVDVSSEWSSIFCNNYHTNHFIKHFLLQICKSCIAPPMRMGAWSTACVLRQRIEYYNKLLCKLCIIQ